ncbi:DUF6624 domain-containing protein [Gemmatimonas sp.]|uniref:DUF6624 domain-containing protein n=1 Tax=Gemmatimonas sp. TaxID=1962908 RepID=UPI0037C04006
MRRSRTHGVSLLLHMLSHHRMRLAAVLRFTCLALSFCVLACGRDASSHAADRGRPARTAWQTATLDTLLRLAREDAADRDAPAQLASAADSASAFKLLRADSLRTRWVRSAVEQHGWPVGSVRGDSALEAAWMILQHSPDTAWQGASLRELQVLAERGDIPKPNVALLTDRVLGQRGEPQVYGSQFDLVESRAVAAPIADLANLDARRARMGLGPMREYVRKLEEVYKVPVVWPPRR